MNKLGLYSEHGKEQLNGLFQVFQETAMVIAEGDLKRDCPTWPDALAEVLPDYGWAIISADQLVALVEDSGRNTI